MLLSILLIFYVLHIIDCFDDSSTSSKKSSGNFLVDTLDSLDAFSSDENMFYWALVLDEEEEKNRH